MLKNIFEFKHIAENILLKKKYRWRNKNFIFDDSLQFYGLPLFDFSPGSRITFGKEVTFISHSRYNMVGLFKQCTICTIDGGVLTIGDNCGFSGVSIYCSNKISIGSHVNVGGNVMIWDTDFHPLNYEPRRINSLDKISTSPICIGDDVFIGANSIVLKGVTIGNKSIIGAGSVVTKNIPENQVWAGNPAKYIRNVS